MSSSRGKEVGYRLQDVVNCVNHAFALKVSENIEIIQVSRDSICEQFLDCPEIHSRGGTKNT